MNVVIVRQATPEDIPAIREVAGQTWRETYTGHIPDADIDCFLDDNYGEQAMERTLANLGEGFLVAELNDGVAGYAMVGHNRGGEAELYAIYVVPDFHGLGLGKTLWRAAVATARRYGARSLGLWVLTSNDPARRFYERQGAVADEEREFAVGDGVVDEIHYSVNLAPQ